MITSLPGATPMRPGAAVRLGAFSSSLQSDKHQSEAFLLLLFLDISMLLHIFWKTTK